jgi:hypothetical protein
MVFKLMLLVVMLSLTIYGGEHGLTGNLRWDLLQQMNDSVQQISPVITAPAEKQNPFVNGLFSLVLPGAGQYRTDNYTKAAVFLAAEVAFAAYAIISDNTADKKTAEFQKYAEEQWSPLRYAQWINTHGAADYGPAASLDLNKVRNYDFSEINDWERGSHKLGFSHSLPKFREQQYYELIGKYNQFKFGWKDYPADINGIPVSDGGRYDDMIPQQLLDYAVDRGKANDYYYAASFAVKALLINHVLSAFDAMLSTASYNNSIKATVQVRPIDRLEGERMMSELKVSVGF